MENFIIRKPTRKIRVGNISIGGDAPITVQSMTNTDTRDAAATISQIRRLEEAGYAYRLVYLQEPGRFRAPRDLLEQQVVADDALRERLFPAALRRRVLLTHMRPEVARGHLWPILPDASQSAALGYRNRGGTLDEAGMLFANRACWGNVVAACARLMDVPRTALLTGEEAAALAGKGDPAVLR